MALQLLLAFKAFNSPTPASSATAPKQNQSSGPFHNLMCLLLIHILRTHEPHLEGFWLTGLLHTMFCDRKFRCGCLSQLLVSSAVRGMEM